MKIKEKNKIFTFVNALFIMFFGVMAMSLPALIITDFAINYLSQYISCISVELSVVILVGSVGLVVVSISGWNIFKYATKLLNKIK